MGLYPIDARRSKCCIASIAVRNNSWFLFDMNEIVEKILTGYAGDVNVAREKVKRYLGLLASAGKSEEQLLVIGTAYLKEMLEPDSRYTGC